MILSLRIKPRNLGEGSRLLFAMGARMKAYLAGFSALACMLAGSLAVAQTQRALLIGINTYQPAGTTADHPAGCIYGRCELGTFENLDGSVNDAQAMADLLTSPKFGFPATNVALLTNPAPPHPGPESSSFPPIRPRTTAFLPPCKSISWMFRKRATPWSFTTPATARCASTARATSSLCSSNGQYVHADSTMVPSDAYKGGYDVRDREMTRIFNAALDKGVHLTVIFDSCHSGGISRGIGPVYRERALAFDPRDINEAPDTLPNGQPRPAPPSALTIPRWSFPPRNRTRRPRKCRCRNRAARCVHRRTASGVAGIARRHAVFARI